MGGDRFQMKIPASQQIQDPGHYTFLHIAPMVTIFGTFGRPVQRAFQKFILLPHSDLKFSNNVKNWSIVKHKNFM